MNEKQIRALLTLLKIIVESSRDKDETLRAFKALEDILPVYVGSQLD